MPDIIRGVSVVASDIGAVLRQRRSAGQHLEIVRPGVGVLRNQPMPVSGPNKNLQRVVIGRTGAFDLVDGAEVRELRKIRTGLLQVAEAFGVPPGDEITSLAGWLMSRMSTRCLACDPRNRPAESRYARAFFRR